MSGPVAALQHETFDAEASPLRVPPTIIGRDAELEAIDRWINGSRPALLEIEGEAGIGKTTLWEAAAAAARDAGATVLTCRPVEVETVVSYGALATLLTWAGARVVCTDPYVTDERLVPLDTVLNESEILILGAPHKPYRSLEVGGKDVVDVWGALGEGIRL
jgi:hypothetical protein